MTKLYRFIFYDQDQEDANRQTLSLAGLAVTLLILCIGVFLTHQLQTKSAIENCIMAGRYNCDILVPKLR